MTGATCPPDGGTCSLPPGIYTCSGSGSSGGSSYCIFNDAVGKKLRFVYDDPDCTPVEFTGGSPRLQLDPILGVVAINNCIVLTSTNVYGPYLIRSL